MFANVNKGFAVRVLTCQNHEGRQTNKIG
jgi:hypothetical protein